MPSGVVQSIDYESEHSRLTVTFTTGRVYEYYVVPPSVAAAFKMARSNGGVFNSEILDRYRCREIAPTHQVLFQEALRRVRRRIADRRFARHHPGDQSSGNGPERKAPMGMANGEP
jgi:hypothetical protein